MSGQADQPAWAFVLERSDYICYAVSWLIIVLISWIR